MRAADAGSLSALRETLTRAGYTAEALAESLRLRPFLACADELPVASRAGGTDRRLTALIELLALDRPVPVPVARSALTAAAFDQLEAGGILTVADDEVLANYRLVAYDGLLLAADRARPRDRDVVMAYTSSSLLLARLAPRVPCRSLLDLGTGSGVLALVAARHCERVTAVDINPRALMFARFNAALNGAHDLELLEGSWFAPVASRRFELVLGNLPFVFSPDDEFTYRDSGRPGGALFEEICRSVPEHLDDGGRAILLASWPHASIDDWAAMPSAWAAASSCDALILRFEMLDPLEHAVRWNAPPVRFQDPEDLRRSISRWLRHCELTGTGQISFGALVLRRRSNGTRWVSARPAPSTPGRQASEQLIALLAGEDLLGRVGGDQRALLGARFSLPDGADVSQRFRRRDGRFGARPAILELAGGLGVHAAIDPDALEILFACDGRLTLGQIVERVSGRRGIDRDDLARIAVTAVRELLALGLLRA